MIYFELNKYYIVIKLVVKKNYQNLNYLPRENVLYFLQLLYSITYFSNQIMLIHIFLNINIHNCTFN